MIAASAVDSAAHRIADQPLVEGGRLEVPVTGAVRRERLLGLAIQYELHAEEKAPSADIADVDEDRAMFGPLRPGEMSLHHGRCFHASGPNRSTDRRIGLAIRYVTPAVRDHAPGRDWAMPVRGEAPSGGWDCIAGPRGLFHPADLALYERILAGQSQTLAAGAEGKVGMYATTT